MKKKREDWITVLAIFAFAICFFWIPLLYWNISKLNKRLKAIEARLPDNDQTLATTCYVNEKHIKLPDGYIYIDGERTDCTEIARREGEVWVEYWDEVIISNTHCRGQFSKWLPKADFHK